MRGATRRETWRHTDRFCPGQAYELELTNRGLNAMDRLKTDVEARAKGVQVITLTPEEQKAFREKVTPVYAAWKDKIGADLVDMVVKATQK